MEFLYEGVSCILKGLKQCPHVSLEGGDNFRIPKQERKGVVLQLMGNTATCLQLQGQTTKSSQLAMPPPVAEVLKHGLPLRRIHDHSIPSTKGEAQPVSVRPYQYPFYQKEEI
jgi:hypothetical protein